MLLGKTGYTDKAGRCFAGFTVDTKAPFVIVVLNAKDRWDEFKKIIQLES